MRADLLIENVNLATMTSSAEPYGQVRDTCLAVADGKICAIGDRLDATTIIDANGGWLTPGLIDCHSHLVFGGDRSEEFDLRLQGISYADIAKRGGGIKSTVKSTRAADAEELFAKGQQHLQRLLTEGVTTVEIKSGYGLDFDTERKLLEVASELDERQAQTIKRTYLGAHALPNEFSDADEYIDYICSEVLPALAAEDLVDAVDVFCEGIGFSPQQCERVYQCAAAHSLPIKAHAEQLSDLKGAALAAQHGALSVDHIEYLSPLDVPLIKDAGTVAVLLPGAFYFLRETQLPPIDSLRQHKVPIAIATDFNPGSSPICSLLTVMNMACVLFRLTPEEVLTGVTHNAAKALGLAQQKGQLKIGYDADLVLWDIDNPAQIVASIGMVKPRSVWVGGKVC